jgi:hypothetical protein
MRNLSPDCRRVLSQAVPLNFRTHSLTDKLYPAESVLTVLAQLDVAKFPWEERVAVGVCQAKALNDWLEVYWRERTRLKLERLFARKLTRAENPTAGGIERSSLSSYLVDRAYPARQ